MSLAKTLCTAWILPFGLLGPAMAQGPSGQTPTTKAQQREQQDQKIRRYLADLARRGPEAEPTRRRAVMALLSMTELNAHMRLRSLLTAGPDPDGVQALILGKLADALENPLHQVFGNAERGVLRQGYLASLVLYITPKALALAAQPGSAQVPAAAPMTPVLRGQLQRCDLARRCLRALPFEDLDTGLRALLKQLDEAGQLACLRAAGETRKRGMARLLAEYLDKDGALRSTAQAAIFNLTYARPVDKAAFLRWDAANRGRSYLDLAEQAARSVNERISSRVQTLEAHRRRMSEALVEVIARSDSNTKWSSLKAQMFGEVIGAHESLFAACLERLCLVLRDAQSNGGDTGERLDFMAQIETRLGEEKSAQLQTLLLEVASYLCEANETEPYQRQRKRLLEALGSDRAALRAAALRGLSRFFSPEVQRSVVKVCDAARRSGNATEVQACINTLGASEWRAPKVGSAEVSAWVAALAGVLKEDGFDPALRREVVRVFGKEDRDGQHPEPVFRALVEMVRLRSIGAEIRQQILLSMRDLMPKGDKAVAFADRYLKCMVALMAPDVEGSVRRTAADQLEVLPGLPKASAQAFGARLLVHLAALLPKESDPEVFAKLVGRLEAVAAVDRSLVETAIRTFCETLNKLGDPAAKTPVAPERLSALVNGLNKIVISGTPGRPVAQWNRACETLLALGRRESLLTVLHWYLAKQDDRERLKSEPPELQAKVWRVVLQTANLRPTAEGWGRDKSDRLEATLILAAAAALKLETDLAKEKALDSEATRLNWLHSLAVLDRHPDLSRLAKTWLGAKALKNGSAEEARLLYAGALLALGRLADSWNQSGIQSVAGGRLTSRLKLSADIARAALAKKDHKLAVTITTDLVSHEPKKGAAYWDRLRLHLSARHAQDPKRSATLLAELDAWLAANPLGKDFDERVQELRNRLSGARPPR